MTPRWCICWCESWRFSRTFRWWCGWLCWRFIRGWWSEYRTRSAKNAINQLFNISHVGRKTGNLVGLKDGINSSVVGASETKDDSLGAVVISTSAELEMMHVSVTSPHSLILLHQLTLVQWFAPMFGIAMHKATKGRDSSPSRSRLTLILSIKWNYFALFCKFKLRPRMADYWNVLLHAYHMAYNMAYLQVAVCPCSHCLT